MENDKGHVGLAMMNGSTAAMGLSALFNAAAVAAAPAWALGVLIVGVVTNLAIAGLSLRDAFRAWSKKRSKIQTPETGEDKKPALKEASSVRAL